MSVATRRSMLAGAAALTIGIVTQSSGSAAQPSGHERAARGHVTERVAVLDRPTDHFKKSLRMGQRKVQRIEAARKARQAKESNGSGAAQSGGGFPSPESVGVSSSTLTSIAACESGGDPSAVSADGTYHGLYQFAYGTWASVGGSGDPAAASPEEQTYRAALLYSQSGSNPWPICG